MRKMQITAGLGRIEDLPAYQEAGADALYAGFVPAKWRLFVGEWEPLNRREVQFVNVQIGTTSELEILSGMARARNLPIAITLNSPFYRPENLPRVLDAVGLCCDYGFSTFIVADPVLLVRIRQAFPEAVLHLSGEFGEVNRYTMALARQLGASRIILPRRTGIAEIQSLVERDRADHPGDPLEFEAFAMNELCHYSGAYCMSLHCDAFAPACRRPWRLSHGEMKEQDFPDVPGTSGCGICSLYALQQAGVTHLKVVSRGARTEETIRDIKALARARDLAASAEIDETYRRLVKSLLFPEGCSGNCYYR